MLVSKKWLQKYFDSPLPATDTLVQALTFGLAEIEGVAHRGDDDLIDIKVLPDRACYLLSHCGIARELAALLQLEMVRDPMAELSEGEVRPLAPLCEALAVSVDDSALAPYYAIGLIRGVKVGPSPEWLKDALESMGQRSINNIVDATNYVMFDLGTPLHAFDAKKVSGNIRVRLSSEGEDMQLLGGAVHSLTGSETLIVDAATDAPLALAGVKGGALAELDSETTDIIVEAATFDPVRTRKTATRLGLKTDASKRFENTVSPEIPALGMRAVAELILKVAGGTLEGYAETVLPYRLRYTVGTSASEVNRLLGTALSTEELEAIIRRLRLPYERVDNPRQRVVEVARAQLGKPYKLGASITKEAPHTFDCSSLTSFAYLCAGASIPRVSIDQYVWGEHIQKDALLPGDLAFFNTKREGVKVWYETVDFLKGKKVPEGVSHVGMYAGDGRFVHARKTDGCVIEEGIEAVEGRVECVGYRRMVSDEPRFVVTVPFERADLRVPQDLIEEIGRTHGYGNIPTAPLESAATPEQNNNFKAAESVRAVLGSLGFSEVYTYTLCSEGDVRLANSLAADKHSLRRDLSEGLRQALLLNEYNAPLLGTTEVVKIFEIGKVFSHDVESLRVGIAVRPLAKKKRAEKSGALLLEAKQLLEESLGVHLDASVTEETLEFDLGRVAPEATTDAVPERVGDARYAPLSAYPFVLRDIALWVPSDVSPEAAAALLREHAGPLLVRTDLFDRFEKEGRTSLAFHMVFQSHEKTLSDSEVNEDMGKIVTACALAGWEVR